MIERILVAPRPGPGARETSLGAVHEAEREWARPGAERAGALARLMSTKPARRDSGDESGAK